MDPDPNNFQKSENEDSPQLPAQGAGGEFNIFLAPLCLDDLVDCEDRNSPRITERRETGESAVEEEEEVSPSFFDKFFDDLPAEYIKKDTEGSLPGSDPNPTTEAAAQDAESCFEACYRRSMVGRIVLMLEQTAAEIAKPRETGTSSTEGNAAVPTTTSSVVGTHLQGTSTEHAEGYTRARRHWPHPIPTGLENDEENSSDEEPSGGIPEWADIFLGFKDLEGTSKSDPDSERDSVSKEVAPRSAAGDTCSYTSVIVHTSSSLPQQQSAERGTAGATSTPVVAAAAAPADAHRASEEPNGRGMPIYELTHERFKKDAPSTSAVAVVPADTSTFLDRPYGEMTSDISVAETEKGFPQHKKTGVIMSTTGEASCPAPGPRISMTHSGKPSTEYISKQKKGEEEQAGMQLTGVRQPPWQIQSALSLPPLPWPLPMAPKPVCTELSLYNRSSTSYEDDQEKPAATIQSTHQQSSCTKWPQKRTGVIMSTTGEAACPVGASSIQMKSSGKPSTEYIKKRKREDIPDWGPKNEATAAVTQDVPDVIGCYRKKKVPPLDQAQSPAKTLEGRAIDAVSSLIYGTPATKPSSEYPEREISGGTWQGRASGAVSSLIYGTPATRLSAEYPEREIRGGTLEGRPSAAASSLIYGTPATRPSAEYPEREIIGGTLEGRPSGALSSLIYGTPATRPSAEYPEREIRGGTLEGIPSGAVSSLIYGTPATRPSAEYPEREVRGGTLEGRPSGTLSSFIYGTPATRPSAEYPEREIRGGTLERRPSGAVSSLLYGTPATRPSAEYADREIRGGTWQGRASGAVSSLIYGTPATRSSAEYPEREIRGGTWQGRGTGAVSSLICGTPATRPSAEYPEREIRGGTWQGRGTGAVSSLICGTPATRPSAEYPEREIRGGTWQSRASGGMSSLICGTPAMRSSAGYADRQIREGTWQGRASGAVSSLICGTPATRSSAEYADREIREGTWQGRESGAVSSFICGTLAMTPSAEYTDREIREETLEGRETGALSSLIYGTPATRPSAEYTDREIRGGTLEGRTTGAVSSLIYGTPATRPSAEYPEREIRGGTWQGRASGAVSSLICGTPATRTSAEYADRELREGTWQGRASGAVSSFICSTAATRSSAEYADREIREVTIRGGATGAASSLFCGTSATRPSADYAEREISGGIPDWRPYNAAEAVVTEGALDLTKHNRNPTTKMVSALDQPQSPAKFPKHRTMGVITSTAEKAASSRATPRYCDKESAEPSTKYTEKQIAGGDNQAHVGSVLQPPLLPVPDIVRRTEEALPPWPLPTPQNVEYYIGLPLHASPNSSLGVATSIYADEEDGSDTSD